MDYQEEYINKNPNMHLEDSLLKVDQISLVIPPKFKAKSLLDVACGAGLVTVKVAEKLNSRYNVGIDISRTMINKAKKVDKDRLVNWKMSDVFNYNTKNKFDLILCVDILEHVENDLEFLKKVGQLGKYIVIKTPLEKSMFSRLLVKLKIFDPWKDTEKRYGHVQHYDEKNLDELFRQSNLTIVNSVSVPMPRRSKLVWEIFRLLFYPISILSMDKMVKISGGFKIVLLKS